MARVQGLGSKFAHLGYVGIALDALYTMSAVNRACENWRTDSSDQCRRAQFRKGGLFTGSVGGGAAGGFLGAYVTCNLVLGIPSGGTSTLWCGIIASGAGAYGGSSWFFYRTQVLAIYD